jgi:hypothetical protein
MDLERIKRLITYYSDTDKNKVFDSFKSIPNNQLSSFEKNFVWNYLFPEPLLDRELPSVIQNAIPGNIDLLMPNDNFVMILIRALRTPQYSKFMKHLLHSFIVDPSLVYPVDGEQTQICPICGKTVYNHKIWKRICDQTPNNPESSRQEHLSFSSKQSDLCLDLDCLVQLNELNNVMNILDPGFLTSYKYDGH